MCELAQGIHTFLHIKLFRLYERTILFISIPSSLFIASSGGEREDDAEESTKRETEGLDKLRKQSREGRTGQSGG